MTETKLNESEKELLAFVARRGGTKGVTLSGGAFMALCWLEGEGYVRKDPVNGWVATGKVAA